MIGIPLTAVLIVGVSAVLTHQAHARRKAAEAEVAVLEARDVRRQQWIATAGQLLRDLEWLEYKIRAPAAWAEVAHELAEQHRRRLELRPLTRDSADHQGAVRIAEHRLAHGMEVPA